MTKAEVQRFVSEGDEFIRVDITLDWQLVFGRLQILTECQDIAAHSAKIAKYRQ
jgi:hypothetical protein